jgi:hypothetical protein
MSCKLQRIVSVCGLALLAAYAPGAAAQVRFIDGVNALAVDGVRARALGGAQAPSSDARAGDDLQARKESIRQRIANGTFRPGKGAKHGRPGDPGLLALPHWTSSFHREGVEYPFTVIGGDPADRRTTVVPTVVIPYRFVFADGGVVDASADVIDGTTQVQGMLASPLLNDFPFVAGATPLGTTQFGDAYMRGNFWQRDGGEGSGYHVRLQVATVVSPALVINVPADIGFSIAIGDGETLGVIDEETLDGILRSVMVGFGIPPSTLTIHAVGQLITVGGGFEAFGYHRWADLRAETQTASLHTYIEASWSSQAVAPFSPNSEVLGHEIAEWLMDPLIANVVPTWNDPGTPSLCWNPTLEVGDVLESFPGQTVALNGRDWTLPDLAFIPWFARISSPYSVNGWFSLFNTVTRFTDTCPFAEYIGAFVYPNDDGIIQTQFTSINNRKQGTGFSVDQSGQRQGFLLDNLDPASPDPVIRTALSVPGSLLTIPVKINDSAQVAGLYVDALGNEHGFLLSAGRFTTIDFPGAVATEVLALDNKDQLTLAGDYIDAAGAIHGFTVREGQYRRFDMPGATNTAIWGINDSNKITGRFQVAGGTLRGFIGTPGKAQPVDYVNVPEFITLPGGINNAGAFAGNVIFTDGSGGGFLAGEGDFIPGNMTVTNDINDQGLIAGGFVVGGSLVGSVGVPLDPHSFGPTGAAGPVRQAAPVSRGP